MEQSHEVVITDIFICRFKEAGRGFFLKEKSKIGSLQNEMISYSLQEDITVNSI